jgi:hypothetical protein
MELPIANAPPLPLPYLWAIAALGVVLGYLLAVVRTGLRRLLVDWVLAAVLTVLVVSMLFQAGVADPRGFLSFAVGGGVGAIAGTARRARQTIPRRESV